MRILEKIFRRETTLKVPRGFYNVTIAELNRLTHNSVIITFDVPVELREKYAFEPGQHINLSVVINGKEERRSYSICSERDTKLSIAVKEVSDGRVSKYLNRDAQEGQDIFISPPNGHFLLGDAKNVIAVAAGSGITPIMSMAYEIEKRKDASMLLFFVNKTEADIMFREQLDSLKKVETRYYLTREEKPGFINKRVDQEAVMAFVKENLGRLKSDGFYICGPEGLIESVRKSLEMFGVPQEKIHFELFSVDDPTAKTPISSEVVQGAVQVRVTLDDEDYSFEMTGKKTVLQAASDADIDPPYSCRGGVCSTCRAKLLKGSVKMDLNYTLTDKEIEEGYILTCQSRPTSDELVISYDE